MLTFKNPSAKQIFALVLLSLLAKQAWAFESLDEKRTPYADFEEEVSALIHPSTPIDKKKIRSSFFRNYSHYLSTDILPNLSTRDLHDLLLATETVAALAPDAELSKYATTALDVLEQRSEAVRPHYISFYQTQIFLNNYDNAARSQPYLLGLLPSINILNLEENISPPSLLVRTSDYNSYERVEYSKLSDGVYFIGHHSCSWTRKALLDIEKDAYASEFFSSSAVYISPHNTILQPAASSKVEFLVAWDPNEWPEIDNWSMPSFYFVKDGSIIHVVRGWPNSSALNDIHIGINKVRQ